MSSSQMFSSVGAGAVSRGTAPDAGAESAAVVVMRPSKQHPRSASKSHADTLESVVISQSIRTALIGAGPRGTSVLERLLANWSAARPAGARLHIDVIDPFPAGPGHVWRPGQSRLYLMNTQSFYPTLVPEDTGLAAPVAGTTFDRWRTAQQRSPLPELSDDERAELAVLGSGDFPSRAIYGRYLRSTLEELLVALPDGVTVEMHQASATAARRRPDGKFDVELDGGGTLTVDSVVLALG